MVVNRLIVGCGAALGACSPAQNAQKADAGHVADAPTLPGDVADADGPGSMDGPSHSIYALAIGRTWHWHYVSGQINCDSDSTVTGTIDIDGRHAFVESYLPGSCGGPTSDFYYAVDASDRMEYRIADRPGWYLWDPPSDGHTWDPGNGSSMFTWHATASATVPAGTFSDCWTATAMPSPGSELQQTFCRGVGQIDTEATFSPGSGYSLRLTSKNF
jgi:hypothetical protein